MSLYRKPLPDPGTLTTVIVSEIDRDKHILLEMLDLHREKVSPLDLTAMLYVNTPNMENKTPNDPTELSKAFLQKLWLLHPQARSTCCKKPVGAYGLNMDPSSRCAINPLDLVAVVYMTANSFLRSEITDRMVQCCFAVPLYLPPVYPEKIGTFLLSPFRDVLGEWTSPAEGGVLKNMASSRMPFLSAVRLGPCCVSKSTVLNRFLGGLHKTNECFINYSLEGGLLPRVLSDGLVEVCWTLSSNESHESDFSRPMLVANLRGDAANSEKQTSLLCYTSAVLVVFCGNFDARSCELLALWRDNARHMIIIDCSESIADDQDTNNEVAKQRLVRDLELPDGMILNGCDGDEERVAASLKHALSSLIPYLHSANLVGMAGMASDLSIKVDEDEICRIAFSEAEEVLSGIEDGVSLYLENQLPLQGRAWKELCQLEKDEGRKQLSEMDTVAEIKEELVKMLLDYQLTSAMRTFIAALCSFDTTKRAFFLSWMRVKLQVTQLDRLPIPDGNQILDPCIGLEHFLREMGLIYERYFRSPNSDLYEMFRLPYIGAELLLYGVPLELFDGDASVVPLNWVYSVLYEVYKQLPQSSRLRVLTVLGFNNSKNAEVLSSLFGVNFPKWGRRQIKGAYVLLLTLPDNFRMEMDCEFLMLICTEGLNRQDSRTIEEDALVHNNELATFVSGLSDVTLVNLPCESPGDAFQRRSNLQIAVNAVLHSMHSERKPSFLVVSEGAGVDGKTMSHAINVLNAKQSEDEQTLNTVHTLINAGNNESQVPQYDQVYSDAVLGLKQSLLGIFNRKEPKPFCLGAFMEHMCNWWESVKNASFGLKFGDTATADAIIGLCANLVNTEEQVASEMNLWVDGLENHITEIKEAASQNDDQIDPDGILRILNEEATTQINSGGEQIKTNLWDFLRKEDANVESVTNYKENLLKRVNVIQDQMTMNVAEKLESATIRHGFMVKMQALLTALEAALEVKLRSLLYTYRNNAIEDKELECEFTSVWEDIPSNLSDGTSEIQDINVRMLELLKDNLSNRGLKNQKAKVLDGSQLREFRVKNDHFALSSKMKKTLKYNKDVAQRFSKKLIEDCDRRVSEKISHKEGYSDGYMKELLAIVDTGLEVLKIEPFAMAPNYEADIKGFICGQAAQSFQVMQESFMKEKRIKDGFLNETRDRHMQNFKYQFHKRDQCQKAAQAFTDKCLKPTAEDFIYNSVERQIFNDMLQKESAKPYSSSKMFHYSLLREMLQKDTFQNFHEYLQSSENFGRKTIEIFVKTHLAGSVMIEDQRVQRMHQICEWMQRCIDQTFENSNGIQNVRQLLEKVSVNLENLGKITVPTGILQEPLFDIATHRENFLESLQASVSELSVSINQEFMENEDVIEVPDDLPLKLQNMLYERVKGCDRICPFCKTPCDLGDSEHQAHQAVFHRPKGLVCYTNANSTTLSHSTCSSDVTGENQFQNRDTEGRLLRFKEYRSIYPDWVISPEVSGSESTSLFWRYVFMRFNSRFAQVYHCAPAVLPESWGKISQKEALRSLREAFDIKE